MQLGYVFLARYAEANSDNTVTTFGGDFDTIRASTFPCAVPVALVVKLTDVTSPGAEPEPLPIVLDVQGPNGLSILDSPIVSLMKPKRIPKEQSATAKDVARIVFNLGPVPLMEPGTYQVRVQIGQGDGGFNISLPLTAEVSNG